MALRSSVLKVLILLAFITTALGDAIGTSSSITFVDKGVQLAINVPTNSPDELFFTFVAPLDSDHGWAGFGMGTKMDNALMFIAYRSEKNASHPTISPRTGYQHLMPTYTSAVNVTALDGTQIVNGDMVLNFHCTGCRKWTDGSLDTNTNEADFFFALGPNIQIHSDDQEFRVRKHDFHSDLFSLSTKAATGTAGVPQIGSSVDKTDFDVSSSGGNSWIVAAHGTMMTLAFQLIFLAGVLMLRAMNKVWVHALFQVIGLLTVIVASALGLYASIKLDISSSLTHPHQIIGLIVLGLVLVAWALGLSGHLIYRQKGVPSPIMMVHRVIAGVTILLGIVNVIVGRWWTGNPLPIWSWISLICLGIAFICLTYWLRTRRARARGNVAGVAPGGAGFFRSGPAAYSQIKPQAEVDFNAAPAPYNSDRVVPLQSLDLGTRQHGHVQYYDPAPQR